MKAAVVEDSDYAREGLIALLSAYPDLEVLCSAADADAALESLLGEPVDVLFLDIHLPGQSGFELLANLGYSPLLIFTTAYSEYALRSFDFRTVDYLLKPISRERLDQAVGKLRLQYAAAARQGGIRATDESRQEQPLEPGSRLLIRDGDSCHLVDLDDIRYVESCRNDALLYFGTHRAFVKRSLNQLERRLPAKQFFRANRQFIVNLRAVKSIEESISNGFSLSMSDGRQIEISRRRAQVLSCLLSF